MILPTILLLVTILVIFQGYRRALRNALEGYAAEQRIWRAEAGRAIAQNDKLSAQVTQKDRDHGAFLDRLRREHKEAIDKARALSNEAAVSQSLKDIINELTRVTWDKRDEDQTYLFSIAVSARLIGLGQGQRPFERDDLIYIARHAGDMLAHEIITSKFARPLAIAPRNDENRYFMPRAKLNPRRFSDEYPYGG